MSTRPSGQVPRFELWNLALPGDVSAVQVAQFGAQAATADQAAAAVAGYRPLFLLEDGPQELNRGLFVDAEGYANAVFTAYWFNVDAYDRWARHATVQAFWSRLPVDGAIGYWREVACVPVDHIDTLYTTHDPIKHNQPGVAQHGTMAVCKAHDYWGAVRDRMPAAGHDELAPELASYKPTTQETRGRRLSVTVPGNVCMARHHEDWREAPVFGAVYRADVAGIKEAGVRHLAAHPELGCVTAREISGQDLDGTATGTADAVAWFLSLEHLLSWTRSDPSHLAIYTAFFKIATTMKEGEVWDVPMWHEVFVVPQGHATAEYVNCHNHTGFLTIVDHQGDFAG